MKSPKIRRIRLRSYYTNQGFAITRSLEGSKHTAALIGWEESSQPHSRSLTRRRPYESGYDIWIASTKTVPDNSSSTATASAPIVYLLRKRLNCANGVLISNSIFDAYLHCPRKVHLLSSSARTPDVRHQISDWQRQSAEKYQESCQSDLLSRHPGGCFVGTPCQQGLKAATPEFILRPIIAAQDPAFFRTRNLAHRMKFRNPSIFSVVARMLPDVLIMGGHYTLDQIVGHSEVKAAGGRVVAIPIVPGYSTTAIIEAAKRAASIKG